MQIDKQTVEKAVSAARSKLEQDSSISWIRSSSSIKRIYYLGLLNGLCEISEEQAVSKELVLSILQDTLWPRGADDSFLSTPVGRIYDDISRRLNHDEIDSRFLVASIDQLETQVSSLCERWQSEASMVKEILQSIRANVANAVHQKNFERVQIGRKDLSELLTDLEMPLRAIALLMLDHNLSKRLKEEG